MDKGDKENRREAIIIASTPVLTPSPDQTNFTITNRGHGKCQKAPSSGQH